MTDPKTPQEVLNVLEKLDGSDQVTVKTYIAKLKAIIEEKENEIHQLKDHDPHAHYHGHEKCTADHDHDQEHHAESTTHSHDHAHDDNDDIPEWKKKAMDADPTAAPFGGSWNQETSTSAATGAATGAAAAAADESNEPEFPPLYESGEDFDKAAQFKMEAADLKSAGNWEEALEKYTQAILCAQPSPLLYANRAMALLKLNRPLAAERDCDQALQQNPDSAKALRIRGKARKALQKWELALKDLSSAQAIDFDEGTVDDLKETTAKHKEMEKHRVEEKLKEEEKLKKRAAEIKKAQEEAKKEAEAEKAKARSAGGGMPGMGGMGGMGGMPGMGGMGGMPGMGGAGGMPGGMGGLMSAIMSDPELAEAMQNPKVIAAFSSLMSSPGGAMGLMSNPAKLQEMMSDPEVGPVLQKLIAKLGPSMGMPGGGGGGGGAGMPGGFGGARGGAGGADDIPDMDDIPDLE